jgi:signal transduction histidine kinase
VTLTTRLNLFFLTALAVVLIGFSTTIYLLARTYFERQNEQRLAAALSTLVAAAEVAPEGIVWDLAERRLSFGSDAWGNQVAWIVTDMVGQPIDQSKHAGAAEFFLSAGLRNDSQTGSERLTWNKEPWLLRWQRVEAPPMKSTEAAAADSAGQTEEERKHRAVSIAAAIPLAPAESALRSLATALAGVSVIVWLVGLVAGRAACLKALLPVTNMATTVRRMDGAELAQRFPIIASGDELEELGRAFNGLLDRLQESCERQRRFTGDASHQLRTPLAAILGQIEVTLRRERTAEEYQMTLATVQQTAGNLRRIVESLLFLARADAEAQVPKRELVDLAAWLLQHLQGWAQHPRFADFVFEPSQACSSQVGAHPVLLGELVNILLDNACKYSQPGTAVTLRVHQETTTIRLDVEDHGCGMTEAEVAGLFRPLFRSAESRRRHTEGVGLGLSIAKRLAKSLGGSISVASRADEGSCFTLMLPAADAPLKTIATVTEMPDDKPECIVGTSLE